MNLCGAFERAVRKSTEGYAEPSKNALQAYAQQLYQSFAEAPAESFTVGTGLKHWPRPAAEHHAGCTGRSC